MREGEPVRPLFYLLFHHLKPKFYLFLFFFLMVWQISRTLGIAAGIQPPGLLEQGRVLLQAHTYHLALSRFLLVEETSENPGEQALALRMIGETQFKDADYAAAYEAYQKSLELAPLSSTGLNLKLKSAISSSLSQKLPNCA